LDTYYDFVYVILIDLMKSSYREENNKGGRAGARGKG
jgi:hypothetical protein